MAKTQIPLAPDIRPEPPRSRVLPIAALFVLVRLIDPAGPGSGLALLCPVARDPGHARRGADPILDAIGDRIETVRRRPLVHDLDQFPGPLRIRKSSLPMLAVVMAIAIRILRL